MWLHNGSVTGVQTCGTIYLKCPNNIIKVVKRNIVVKLVTMKCYVQVCNSEPDSGLCLHCDKRHKMCAWAYLVLA